MTIVLLILAFAVGVVVGGIVGAAVVGNSIGRALKDAGLTQEQRRQVTEKLR